MPRQDRRRRLALVILAVAVALGLSGCSRSESAEPTAAAPTPVRVSIVEQQQVMDWNGFTGRFEAVESVELRPRVSGYIDEVRFTEGSVVQKGDILFIIDPRPYQLQLERAEADLARADAQARLARMELARAEKLLAAHAISKEEHDRRVSQRQQFGAEYQAARAAVESARLNLEYTRVRSPITGRASRAEVTAGNYVGTGATVLTSIVSLDPIYVTFDSDEQSYLQYERLVRNGVLPKLERGETPVHIGLSGGRDFPYTGTLNFIDNALDPSTGTIHTRALIDNPQHRFVPGMVARVRLQESGEYSAALIDDAAVATDQGRKYVLVVDERGIAEYRLVELGDLIGDRRVVRSGLQGGERVIIGGMQRVRPGMLVQAEIDEPVRLEETALNL